MKRVMVRYKVKPDHTAENERYIQRVYRLFVIDAHVTLLDRCYHLCSRGKLSETYSSTAPTLGIYRSSSVLNPPAPTHIASPWRRRYARSIAGTDEAAQHRCVL